MAAGMHAVAVARFRAPLETVELGRPGIRATELLVRVEFAGMNPFDWKIAQGFFEGKRPHVFPLVLGVDAAGIVEEVGADVRQYRVGDRVFGQFLHDPVGTGTYAEYAPVPEDVGIATVPSGLTSYEAAALPTAGMTALLSVETLEVPAGSTIVIVGASGGVGSFATALAAARGVRVVAVARAAAADRLRNSGASAVVDPSTSDPIGAVRELAPAGVEGLIDVMSDGPGFARWASLVKPHGIAATTTFVADQVALGSSEVRAVNINMKPEHDLLERLGHAVVEHHLKVPVERRIRLPEAPGVLAEIWAGKSLGKTVIDLRS